MSGSLTVPESTLDDPPAINRVARALNRVTSPASAPRPILDAHRWLYERSELWTLMNSANHGRYDHYQAQTGRPIPLVVIARDHTLAP